MEENQVKKKEINFKGKTISELKNLGVREFAALLRSRQRRTVLRNFQEHENFVKRVNLKLDKGKKSVKTHRRDLVIVPGLVDKKIQIYNGREFIPVDITIEMLGHKLGEFAPTRAKARHVKEGKKR
ncbi:MAG TPA: ribosomal protein S19 family protein [Candidatus Nanoarchaeia archaeon]|nr:ribosomal protein S19 family protein [Candidatus Nanoarchaeia archaeon]